MLRFVRQPAWLVWIALATCAAPAQAAPPLPGAAQRQARDEAIRLIPLAKLQPQHRARVQQIVEETTLFRRLPTQTIACDPKFYLFMVEHPEVVVSLWRALGLSEIKLTRTGEQSFRADDGAGTTGALEYIHRSHDTHILLADGAYEGALLPKSVRGQCVLILRTTYTRETDGKYRVNCRLDSFVRLENVTFDVLVKTFQPLFGQMADHNFRETIAFVGGLSQAAEANPDGIHKVAEKMRDIPPEVRTQFIAHSERMAAEAVLPRSESAAEGRTVTRPQVPARMPRR